MFTIPPSGAVAANAMDQGCKSLCVTLGARGAAYFTGTPIRTERISAPAIHPQALTQVTDPTGCGDVFGAAAAARLFAGDPVEAAIRHANAMAARNAAFRGAGGLSRHLRGELVLP